MEDAYKLRFPLHVYYRGAFSQMTKQENEQNWAKEQKQITKEPVSDSLQLFQILNILPTFEEVQVGFTYFFFRHDTVPDWNKNLKSFQLEALVEVTDEYTKFKPEQWKSLKSELEACMQMLILMWAGNSSKPFESVIGVTTKIRRARVTFSIWFNDEDDGEALEEAVSGILHEIDFATSAAKCELAVTSLRYEQDLSSNRSSRASSRSSDERRGNSVHRSWSRESQGRKK